MVSFFVFGLCRLFPFHLHSVEAVAVNADDGALRDKGCRVNGVDNLEYFPALALLDEHEKNVCFIARIRAIAFENGASAVMLLVDASGDFVIFLGDDEKLNRAAHGVDYLVEAECRHIEHHIAEDDALPVAQYQITGGDDNDVANHHDMSE